MSRAASVPRILVAFTLVGAGLVNLGLVRGAFPHPQGALALVAGATELVAAVLVLRGTEVRGVSRTALGRAAVGGLAVASVLGMVLGVAQGAHLGAAAAAAALQLAAAAAVGATTRPRDGGAAPAEPSQEGAHAVVTGRRRRPAVSLAILFAGAVAVSTVASAGLADTEAGDRAVPHSEHHLPDLPRLEGHHHGP